MFYNNKNLLSPTKQRAKIVILLMFVTMVPQLSLDLYLPSMPAMQDFFGTSHVYIQYTLLAYLLGSGLTSIIYGPLIDKYGRRPIAIFSAILFFIASLGCIKTNNIYYFIFWRIIQGTGDGAIYVIYRATLRDLFDHNKLAKVISYASMVWVMTPIIAPFAGGYVQHYADWRMNFIIIFILSAIALIVIWRYFPETRHDIDPTKITEVSVAKKYLMMIKNPIFIGFVSCNMLANVIMLCYNLISPFILQVSLDVSVIHFGWLATIAASGYILGSIINGKFVESFGKKNLNRIAAGIMVFAVLLLITLANYFSVVTIVAPITIMFIGFGICYPNFSSSAMQLYKHNAGMAGALFGTIQTGIAVLISLIATVLPHNTILPFAILCFINICIIAVIMLKLEYVHSN